MWEKAQAVRAPGALDPLVKKLVYFAVSVTNGCATATRGTSKGGLL